MGDYRGVQGVVPGGVHTPETLVRVQPPQPSPKQSRRMSLIEAISNVAVGFLVALLTQVIVFPLFNIKVSLSEHLAIGGLFTLLCRARHNPVYAEHIVMRSSIAVLQQLTDPERIILVECST
jgi:hypothetical protein